MEGRYGGVGVYNCSKHAPSHLPSYLIVSSLLPKSIQDKCSVVQHYWPHITVRLMCSAMETTGSQLNLTSVGIGREEVEKEGGREEGGRRRMGGRKRGKDSGSQCSRFCGQKRTRTGESSLLMFSRNKVL